MSSTQRGLGGPKRGAPSQLMLVAPVVPRNEVEVRVRSVGPLLGA